MISFIGQTIGSQLKFISEWLVSRVMGKVLNIKKILSFHRKLSIGITFYLIIILFSGILLLLRRNISAIQPKLGNTASKEVMLSPKQILTVSKKIKDAEIKGWNDISHFRVYFDKGYVLVRTKSGYQIQIDGVSAKVLSHGKRWTGWLIQLHEGTLFGKGVYYGVYLPASILFLVLLVTGVYLFFAKAPRRKSVSTFAIETK